MQASPFVPLVQIHEWVTPASVIDGLDEARFLNTVFDGGLDDQVEHEQRDDGADQGQGGPEQPEVQNYEHLPSLCDPRPRGEPAAGSGAFVGSAELGAGGCTLELEAVLNVLVKSVDWAESAVDNFQFENAVMHLRGMRADLRDALLLVQALRSGSRA